MEKIGDFRRNQKAFLPPAASTIATPVVFITTHSSTETKSRAIAEVKSCRGWGNVKSQPDLVTLELRRGRVVVVACHAAPALCRARLTVPLFLSLGGESERSKRMRKRCRYKLTRGMRKSLRSRQGGRNPVMKRPDRLGRLVRWGGAAMVAWTLTQPTPSLAVIPWTYPSWFPPAPPPPSFVPPPPIASDPSGPVLPPPPMAVDNPPEIPLPPSPPATPIPPVPPPIWVPPGDVQPPVTPVEPPLPGPPTPSNPPAVPEPSTLVLGLIGVAVAANRLRQQRQRRRNPLS